MNELERIALLARHLGHGGPAGSVGIGDDAAVVPLAGEGRGLVWTIDAQVEGTHFRRAWVGWEDVGYRSFMAAASDLAAMAASPLAALSALALDPSFDDAMLEALARGQAEAARVVGAPILGGNLARAGETSVTTTLIGRAERAVLRSGAMPGDALYLAGAVGMAAAGLAALEAGRDAADASLAACVEAWRRPRALIELGVTMGPRASAALDVSDGLARDARHLAEASAVTVVLDERGLRARAAGALEEAARLLGLDVLDLALSGGEDYALLVASASPIDGFERVGWIEAGPGEVVLAAADGARSAVGDRGFDHFRARP